MSKRLFMDTLVQGMKVKDVLSPSDMLSVLAGREIRHGMKPRLKWHVIGIWAYTNESIFRINKWTAQEIRYYAEFVEELNSYVMEDET